MIDDAAVGFGEFFQLRMLLGEGAQLCTQRAKKPGQCVKIQLLAAYEFVECRCSHYFVVWNGVVFVDLLQCVQVVTPEPGIALGLFQAAAQ
ncbi:hypothetical protein D3C77_707040 [compost metagenome]